MLAYRIVHKTFSKQLVASAMPGRWNSAGNKVIYAADSIPLAFLENMIRRQGVGFNDDFKIMILDIPDRLLFETIDLKQLKTGWRNMHQYSQTQLLGDDWYHFRNTVLLQVPSAVLTSSNNYVINTEHPDFIQINLLAITDLVPDERIESILKKKRK
jgi:RES domain-containing protein